MTYEPKFKTGDIVYINTIPYQDHFKQNCLAIVIGTYNHLCDYDIIKKCLLLGPDNVKLNSLRPEFQYSLLFSDGYSRSWYDEQNLTFVRKASQDEIINVLNTPKKSKHREQI